jgi:hypothetical protein
MISQRLFALFNYAGIHRVVTLAALDKYGKLPHSIFFSHKVSSFGLAPLLY